MTLARPWDGGVVVPKAAGSGGNPFPPAWRGEEAPTINIQYHGVTESYGYAHLSLNDQRAPGLPDAISVALAYTTYATCACAHVAVGTVHDTTTHTCHTHTLLALTAAQAKRTHTALVNSNTTQQRSERGMPGTAQVESR
eukprot:scaffold16057_cov91-Isochrysis_galbana.AAC.2